MRDVKKIINEVIESIDRDIYVYSIIEIDGGWRLLVNRTLWVTLKNVLTLNEEVYEVTDYIENASIDVTGEVEPTIGTMQARPISFVYGKYSQINSELSQQPDKESFLPLIWMFENNVRRSPQQIGSAIDSEGTVRLFFLATTDWQLNRVSDEKEVITPMRNLVTAFSQKLLANSNINRGNFFDDYREHSKFTTGGDGINTNGKNVFGQYLSGCEYSAFISLRKDYCTLTGAIERRLNRYLIIGDKYLILNNKHLINGT